MTDPYHNLFAEGKVPTAGELLRVVTDQGYRIALRDGKPTLTQVHKNGDRDLVIAIAGILKREPFKSAVLKEIECGNSAVEPARPPPVEQPKAKPGTICRVCRAWVANREVLCNQSKCPFEKVGPEPQALSLPYKRGTTDGPARDSGGTGRTVPGQ